MDKLSKLDAWIATHQLLVVSLGLPLLTIILAAIVGYITTHMSLSAQKADRLQVREIQISQFRQQWVNELRNEFAEFSSLIIQDWEKDSPPSNMGFCAAKTLFLMNPDDPDYDALVDIQKNLIEAKEKTGESDDVHLLISIGQRILKREWERLKLDLVRLDK